MAVTTLTITSRQAFAEGTAFGAGVLCDPCLVPSVTSQPVRSHKAMVKKF